LDALLYDFPEHLPAVRAFCRLTSIASLDALAAGDGAGAVDAVLLTLKAGNALRESPKAVTYLVRLACLGMAEEQAHYLVRSGQCAPGDYLRLSRAFGEAYAGEQVRRCAAAERVRTLDSLDDLPAVKWYAIRSGLEGYETFEAMLEADAAERRAYARGPLGGGPFSHFLPEGGGPALALSLIDPMGKEILQQEAIEVKELPRLLTAHLGMAARMRAAEAAAAAAAYRADQGRLPPALETLTPDYLEAVPEDPYIGEPLRYVVEGARFYVYAVHLDGEDDSGRADAHRGRYGEGDVGLTRDDWMRERGARTWRGLAPSPSL
jgi:hypothetical protein